MMYHILQDYVEKLGVVPRHHPSAFLTCMWTARSISKSQVYPLHLRVVPQPIHTHLHKLHSPLLPPSDF